MSVHGLLLVSWGLEERVKARGIFHSFVEIRYRQVVKAC